MRVTIDTTICYEADKVFYSLVFKSDDGERVTFIDDAWHFGTEVDPDCPMQNETVKSILYLAGDAKLKWLHDRMFFEINHKLYEEITI